MFRRLAVALRWLVRGRRHGSSGWAQDFRARHGLGRNTGETLAEVERQLAESRNRIRQIERLAAKRRWDRED